MKICQLCLCIAFVATLANNSSAAVFAGETIGIDFGGTADTDAATTWNQISVGGNASTAGLNDAGLVVLNSLNNTSGTAVSGVTFSLLNSSGQIAWDFGLGGTGAQGTDGNGALVTDSTVFADGIISNDANGRTVAAGADTFVLTFSGLDDSLAYDLVGGWDSNNANFEAVWSADSQSFTTNPNGPASAGYGSLTGLSTDGSGNLVITVTGSTANAAAHITVGALALTAVAVPEPSSLGLFCLGIVGVLIRRRR